MKARKWLYILITVLLIVILGIYLFQANFFKSHYLPNTTANGTDISSLTKAEAEKVLVAKSAKEQFDIVENGQAWQEIPKSQLGIEYDYGKDLEKILQNQNNYTWVTAYLKTNEQKLSDASLNEESLTSFVTTLEKDLTALNKDRKVSTNATIKKGEAGFEIVPEVQGTNLDTKKVIARLKEDLAAGKSSLDLKEFVVKPTIAADNADLKKNLAEVSTVIDQETAYLINGETITIPKETISSWISYDQKNNQVDLDKEKVRAYVASLGDTYNTSTNSTKFKSTKRGEVTIPAGSYSWTIQTDTETEELYQAILAGQGVNRSPIIAGSASVGSPLIGNTYVEVDLQNQHMYFYKNGDLVLDTDIVSGKPTTLTPPGVNYLWKKERNSILRGTNDDGSKYAEPVDYWMPIDWTGVGIHDSDWQPAYGGELWKTAGSHGCINTPPAVAAKLYEAIDVGTPVLVF